MVAINKKVSTKCYHCGDDCKQTTVVHAAKSFCCHGCKTVYELINESELCDYYSLESTPGNKQTADEGQYAYLDSEEIVSSLLDFKDEKLSGVTLYIPNIHCSSCIWLLENLHKVHAGIVHTHIQFQKKTLSIQFNNKITFQQLAVLLANIGYPPLITLNGKTVSNQSHQRKQFYRLGIAGFCFVNIMMLSLPEYLSVFDVFEGDLKTLFAYLSLLMALPVYLYSANEYFVSAFKAIRAKTINLDVPIAIGLSAAFFQSTYEIVMQSSVGYMDSLTGLVFFLLIGKWYQQKVYAGISFDRDYKSYFPLAACKITNNAEQYVKLQDLAAGDTIVVRNHEIIPADGYIVYGTGHIDYSFVTGESNPVTKIVKQPLFAGGRQIGTAIKVKLTKAVSESYLTQLWNKDKALKTTSTGIEQFTNMIGKYFTMVVLALALSTYLYWFSIDHHKAVFSAVSVLIIFCPCTLALAIPFCFGRAINMLGKNGLYLKNTQAIEQLASIETVVFDKTGTLTTAGTHKTYFEGTLTDKEKVYIKSVAIHSTHPLSKAICNYLEDSEMVAIAKYQEIVSKGITATVDNNIIKIGSGSFINGTNSEVNPDNDKTTVYIQINSIVKGYYVFANEYKPDMSSVLNQLSANYSLHLLSGDNDAEKQNLQSYFKQSNMHFSQSPSDKAKYVEGLNVEQKVMMVGDGLNDAGALANSYCGITVIEKSGSFSPACDGMLDAKSFGQLPQFIGFAKRCLHRVYWSFAISMLYNIVGLTFAFQGLLKPLVAAIVMPMSSVSVVLFVTLVAPKLKRAKNLIAR